MVSRTAFWIPRRHTFDPMITHRDLKSWLVILDRCDGLEVDQPKIQSLFRMSGCSQRLVGLSVDVATLSGLGGVYALQSFSKAMFEPRLNLLLDRPVYGPTDTELQ